MVRHSVSKTEGGRAVNGGTPLRASLRTLASFAPICCADSNEAERALCSESAVGASSGGEGELMMGREDPRV